MVSPQQPLTNIGKDMAWDPDHSGVDTSEDLVRFNVHRRSMAAELHSTAVAVGAAEDVVVVAGAVAGVAVDGVDTGIMVTIEFATWENFNELER